MIAIKVSNSRCYIASYRRITGLSVFSHNSPMTRFSESSLSIMHFLGTINSVRVVPSVKMEILPNESKTDNSLPWWFQER